MLLTQNVSRLLLKATIRYSNHKLDFIWPDVAAAPTGAASILSRDEIDFSGTDRCSVSSANIAFFLNIRRRICRL